MEEQGGQGRALGTIILKGSKSWQGTMEMLHCILNRNRSTGRKVCGACKGLSRVMCFLRRRKEVCNVIHLSLNDFLGVLNECLSKHAFGKSAQNK